MHERDKLEYFIYGTIIVKCSDSWFTKPLKERFNDEHDDDDGDEVAVACVCVVDGGGRQQRQACLPLLLTATVSWVVSCKAVAGSLCCAKKCDCYDS